MPRGRPSRLRGTDAAKLCARGGDILGGAHSLAAVSYATLAQAPSVWRRYRGYVAQTLDACTSAAQDAGAPPVSRAPVAAPHTRAKSTYLHRPRRLFHLPARPACHRTHPANPDRPTRRPFVTACLVSSPLGLVPTPNYAGPGARGRLLVVLLVCPRQVEPLAQAKGARATASERMAATHDRSTGCQMRQTRASEDTGGRG